MSSIHCFFTYIYVSKIVSCHDIEPVLILLCKCILLLCSHDSPVPCHRHCLQCVAIARNYPVCMWLCAQKNEEQISWSALDNCKVLAVVIVLGWIPQKMDLKQSFVCRWFIRGMILGSYLGGNEAAEVGRGRWWTVGSQRPQSCCIRWGWGNGTWPLHHPVCPHPVYQTAHAGCPGKRESDFGQAIPVS